MNQLAIYNFYNNFCKTALFTVPDSSFLAPKTGCLIKILQNFCFPEEKSNNWPILKI